MQSARNTEFLRQHSSKLFLACALAMTSLTMMGCAAKRTVSNSSSVSTTQVSAPAPDVDPIEEDSEHTEREQPPNTLATSNLSLGNDWKTAPCANEQPRKPKTGNCPEMPLCPRRCSWSLPRGMRQSCWTTQGQNVVTGYSEQRAPDGKPCAWVKE